MNTHFTHTKKLFNKTNIFTNEGIDVVPSGGLSLPGFRNCSSHPLMPSSSPNHEGGK